MPAADEATFAFVRGLSELQKQRYLQATAWFQVALKAASDFLGAAFYIGACHAASGRDQDAVGAWQLSLLSDAADVVYPPLVDGLLRLGDGLQALTFIDEAPDAWKDDDTRDERQATAEAMTGAYVPALEKLHGLIERRPDDMDLTYLALQVMYRVRQETGSLTEDDRDRFVTYANRYTAAKGSAGRARRARGSSTWPSRSGALKRLDGRANRRRGATRRAARARTRAGAAWARTRRSSRRFGTLPRPSRGITAAPSPAPTSASCVAYSEAVCATRGSWPRRRSMCISQSWQIDPSSQVIHGSATRSSSETDVLPRQAVRRGQARCRPRRPDGRLAQALGQRQRRVRPVLRDHQVEVAAHEQRHGVGRLELAQARLQLRDSAARRSTSACGARPRHAGGEAGDRQRPADDVARRFELGLGALQHREHLLGVGDEPATGVGEPHAAALLLQQPPPDFAFELGELL